MQNIKELEKNAKSGDAVAMFILGRAYMRGEYGVKEDKESAKKYLIQAFPKIKKQAEEDEKQSQFCLGYYYDMLGLFLGDCNLFEPFDNNDKIIPLYTKSAEQGFAEAQYMLGLKYLFSSSIAKRDENVAFYWLKKAAEQGNANAQNCLGRCYENGEGVEANEKMAIFWFTKAAKEDEVNAQSNLGRCYKEGEFKDFDKAFYWLSKAVQKDNAVAMEYLAECYEKGIGTEKDLEKAAKLYAQALKKIPNGYSKTALQRVKRKLKDSHK